MRLVELIAEYYYLKDTNNAPIVPFKAQDSNVRDFYFKTAYNVIPQLIHSYLSQGTWLGKLVRGSIRDFINSHGTLLDKNNFNSLAKRITRNISGKVKTESRQKLLTEKVSPEINRKE